MPPRLRRHSRAQQRTRTFGLQLLGCDDGRRGTLQVIGYRLDPDLDGSRRLGGVEVLKRKDICRSNVMNVARSDIRYCSLSQLAIAIPIRRKSAISSSL